MVDEGISCLDRMPQMVAAFDPVSVMNPLNSSALCAPCKKVRCSWHGLKEVHGLSSLFNAYLVGNAAFVY